MGLFGTSDPVKKEEKALAKEAKHDDKAVKQAQKELAKTEKEEHKAEKAHDKALKEHSKVVALEHKLSERVNAAVHKHDEAVSKENKVNHDIQASEQYRARVEHDLALKKQNLEQVAQQHHVKEHDRVERQHALQTAHVAPGTTAPTSAVHPGTGVGGEPYTTGATPGTGLSTSGGVPTHATTGTVPAGERY
ncbi:hypothetical protein QFC22_004069 [Naganishia vaughanmartiniae]|uniref:Uncharacterized protein n=1 Tax=Naganishia vaughanmartiniae TaxID=1424756 RepID=A0ACC2X2A4_9TREE|nr:hypothetical protein QFC22_004069 [Naganishia vaughanmartiniae]